MTEERPTACELFNGAADAFSRGDMSAAVTCLRSGFFENLYISPLLLGEEFFPQKIWYASGDAEPQAAREYIRRYDRYWKEDPRIVEFLSVVWNDPLVRAELTKYLNLSKNLLAAGSEADFNELLRERELFLNPERIKRTQEEILARVRAGDLRLPLPRPRLTLTMLASSDPAASVDFYRTLLDLEPTTVSRDAGGYAEFEFEGVHLAVHGCDRPARGDPYDLGPPPQAFGWGALFVIQVAQIQPYYDNAVRAGIKVVDREMGAQGRRFFVVKDPSGYLLEITEETPKGLQVT